MSDENSMEPKTEDAEPIVEPMPASLPEPPKRRGRPKKVRENVIDTQGWGSTSKVIAPEPEPNPVVLPDAEGAVAALAMLADLNDKALAAHEKWQDSAKRTKDLKGKWETLVESLQAALKNATHPAPLPLFDAQQAEQDLQRMEAAVGAMGQSDDLGSTEDASGTLLAGPWSVSDVPDVETATPEPEATGEAPAGSAELF